MRKAWVATLVAALASSAVGAEEPATAVFRDEIEVVGDVVRTWPVETWQRVEVSFSAGELALSATEGSEVEADLRVECPKLTEERCDRYRRRAHLTVASGDEALTVRLTGVPFWRMRRLELHGEIRYPSWAPLRLSMGAGAVEIDAGESDVSVRLRAGDLVVRAPGSAVGSVAMRAGVGDVALHGPGLAEDGRRRRLVGDRLEWDGGSGAAHLDVHLTVGAAEVRLDAGRTGD